jgi:hypothetical protein
MHQIFPPHLAQRYEVDVGEARVPPPGIFTAARHQADWPCHGDVEHVQPPGAAVDLGQQLHLLVMNPHEATFNVDLECTHIELATTDDVCSEARNVGGIEQHPMLPVLACEKDGTTTLDPHDGAITESHGVDDASVEIRVDLLDIGDVIGGPCVEDQPLGVSFSCLP